MWLNVVVYKQKEDLKMVWNLMDEVETLRRDLERALESHGVDRWTRPFSRFSFLPGVSARTYPLMNLGEDTDNFYIEALAPGVDPDSLEISVVDNTLRVAGEKRPISEDVGIEAFHRNERSAGRFVRTLRLDVPVDQDKITAEYKNGLLLITLPKAEAAKPKQISVKVT